MVRTMLGWRLRFQFFDRELVKQKEPAVKGEPRDEPHQIIQKISPNFTCSTSGRGMIACGGALSTTLLRCAHT